MPIKTLPPVEYLRQCFTYDPETGVLTWRIRPQEHFPSEPIWKMWNKQNAGKTAGSINARGYWRLGRKGFRANRIIFKLMTSEEPPSVVDHKDGDKLNNRWSNLRPATYSESTWNVRIHVDNKSGRRGVIFKKGKWEASIMIAGRIRRLGRFHTLEEASVAYEATACAARGEFHRPTGG